MKKELENRYIQRPAIELAEGGVIGFNARMSGWMLEDQIQEKDVCAYFWACEKKKKGSTDKADNYGSLIYPNHYYLKLEKETGNIDIIFNPASGDHRYHSVRLIQKIQRK